MHVRTTAASRRVVPALILAAALAVALMLALSGSDVNPFAYSPARRAAFEQRAADGESHLLYANSPGGATATAQRVAALDGPIGAAAAAAHVDPSVVEGMVYLESGGRPDAIAGGDVSGAAGVSQILAQTATGLLGLHVDLAASRRLTGQIAAARQAHDAALVSRLEARRRRADERFDAAKALAATGRYLTLAQRTFGRADLAVESYHMGIGNLATVIRTYAGERRSVAAIVRDRKLTYAQLYFDSTPRHNHAAYALLAAFGDDSATYYWRVLAAREIMRLYRGDRARLDRLARLQTSYGSGEGVLHPPGSTTVFADPAALARARADRTLREIPDEPLARHFTLDPAIGAQARERGRDARDYTTLRPEALAVLYYIADRVYSISHARAPLVVAAATRDAEGDRRYSLDTTGWSFDIRRRYATPKQAQAFQQMLDRLQALDVIAWQRSAGVIHVTASEAAHPLVPLVDGASLDDAS